MLLVCHYGCDSVIVVMCYMRYSCDMRVIMLLLCFIVLQWWQCAVCVMPRANSCYCVIIVSLLCYYGGGVLFRVMFVLSVCYYAIIV